jgi:colicin import membrane protein
MDYYDAYGNPVMKPKSSNAALLPVLLVLLASAGGNYWLWKERAKSSAEANAATAKLAALDAMQKEMTERLATLEAERATLIEAKDQAIKDAQAKALELAKLKDDVAGVAGTEEKDDEAGKDDKGKADDKKADAKAADKKADAKADKKAKLKAEKKAKAKAAKKEASSKSSADREL